MNNAELIKALRYCAEHDGCDYYIAKDCPRESTWVCGADCEQILMRDAAAALKAADKRIAELSLDCELFQQKCMELEAQLPKEGEWIDAFVGELPVQVCSKCNTFFPLAYTGGGHHYCPNCGAKMKGANDEADS